MKYNAMTAGRFIDRPNRFIAHVEIDGRVETVHVKNTGRCAELLKPQAEVFLQKCDTPGRKTLWDLIAVQKGELLINMDSQIPNQVFREWAESGGFLPDVRMLKSEVKYGDSRLDFYMETGKETVEQKIFIEVKGVTLEENGEARFPDAPSERAVKHVTELMRAVREGYQAYIFFVIQMDGMQYLTPNRDTHPAFAEVLQEAAEAGVHILAYDCQVTPDSIVMQKEIPVILGDPLLKKAAQPLVDWYRANKRDLPWRKDISAYHVWVSEIMLQQTRVEAVKGYYERFLKALPDIHVLAEAPEEQLLKLWEGLGYYNRVRNMQAAAKCIMEDYQGEFPRDYDAIRNLKGIGSYTAGAICSFAYGIPKAAVDGNVLRVVSRLLGSQEDIAQAAVKRKIEKAVEEVIPPEAASDFNQGLIELGALLCIPAGEPKCGLCPLASLCRARKWGQQVQIPVKSKLKKRRLEQKTVFLFEDNEKVAIRKRPAKGLLAGLYEFPNVPGYLDQEEAVAYSKSIGLIPVRIQALQRAKHIFSHVEWHMQTYLVRVDELEKNCTEKLIFAGKDELDRVYPIPSAFEAYRSLINPRGVSDRPVAGKTLKDRKEKGDV